MKQSVDEPTAAVLQRLELSLMDPQVRRDRNQVSGLLSEDFVEFGASGRTWTREATLDLLASENYTSPRMEQFACFALGPLVALVTYRTVRNGEHGEPVTTLRSSIWTKESGKWKLRFHQGTRAS